MNDATLTTLDEVRHFFQGTAVVDRVIDAKAERYAWIQQTPPGLITDASAKLIRGWY